MKYLQFLGSFELSPESRIMLNNLTGKMIMLKFGFGGIVLGLLAVEIVHNTGIIGWSTLTQPLRLVLKR